MTIKPIPDLVLGSYEVAVFLSQPQPGDQGINWRFDVHDVSIEDFALLYARGIVSKKRYYPVLDGTKKQGYRRATDTLYSLDKIAKIVHISASRLAEREREAKMRIKLLMHYGRHLPDRFFNRLDLSKKDTAIIKLLHREPLDNFWGFHASAYPGTKMEQDCARMKAPQLRTAALKIIKRRPNHKIDDCVVADPITAILQGRIDQYNRNHRTNNNERWEILVDDLIAREEEDGYEALSDHMLRLLFADMES